MSPKVPKAQAKNVDDRRRAVTYHLPATERSMSPKAPKPTNRTPEDPEANKPQAKPEAGSYSADTALPNVPPGHQMFERTEFDADGSQLLKELAMVPIGTVVMRTYDEEPMYKLPSILGKQDQLCLGIVEEGGLAVWDEEDIRDYITKNTCNIQNPDDTDMPLMVINEQADAETVLGTIIECAGTVQAVIELLEAEELSLDDIRIKEGMVAYPKHKFAGEITSGWATIRVKADDRAFLVAPPEGALAETGDAPIYQTMEDKRGEAIEAIRSKAMNCDRADIDLPSGGVAIRIPNPLHD